MAPSRSFNATMIFLYLALLQATLNFSSCQDGSKLDDVPFKILCNLLFAQGTNVFITCGGKQIII